MAIRRAVRMRGRAIFAVGAILAALVLGAAVTGGTALAGGTVYWKNFGKPVEVEPVRIDINYSTGYAWATGLNEWSGWGGERATAEGVLHLNTCRPFCAAGNYKAYKGRVTLFKVRRCGKQRRYIDIKIKVSSRAPTIWGSDCRGLQIENP